MGSGPHPRTSSISRTFQEGAVKSNKEDTPAFLPAASYTVCDRMRDDRPLRQGCGRALMMKHLYLSPALDRSAHAHVEGE